MNIKEIIDEARPAWGCGDFMQVQDLNPILDRIEAAVTERTKELEASVESYERLLDTAYDDFQECADNWDVREVLKELIEYAPRKNWEDK